MSKRENGWTTLAVFPMLMLPLTGCVSVGSGDAICAGTESARTEHAAALARDGGPTSLVSGARLISLIDAGCGQ